MISLFCEKQQKGLFSPGPLGDLFTLNILKTTLMEANPDCGTKPLLPVVTREVPKLLDLDLVRLKKEAVRELQQRSY